MPGKERGVNEQEDFVAFQTLSKARKVNSGLRCGHDREAQQATRRSLECTVMEARHGKTCSRRSKFGLLESCRRITLVANSGRLFWSNGESCDRRALLEFDVLELPEALLGSPYSKIIGSPLMSSPRVLQKKVQGSKLHRRS